MRKRKAALAISAGLWLATTTGSTQTPDWTSIAPRPLEEVRLFLEDQYEKPVTYEDPVWRWIGDSVSRGSEPDGPFGRWLWDRRLDLPAAVSREETPKLDLSLVQRVIDAYHRQNPGDIRFIVAESALGLHIIPAQFHDENGALVKGGSLLDTTIAVPSASRMPSEHLRALCEAVTSTSGIKLELSAKWADQFFAPNHAVPPYGAAQLSIQEKAPYSFGWGTRDVRARDALIALVGSSSTTFSWALLCQPSLKPENRSCTLNVAPLQLTRTGPDGEPIRKALSYDRCGKCDFLNR